MGSCTENRLFKLFVVVVFLSHCVHIVWNSPMPMPETTSTTQGPHPPPNTKTYPNVELYKAKAKKDDGSLRAKIPNAIKSTSDPSALGELDPLCSLFSTFLANGSQKNVKCKINSVFEVKSRPLVSDSRGSKQITGLIDLLELEASGSSNHNQNSIKDSNSRIDIVGETFDGYADITGNEAESVTRRIPLSFLYGSRPQSQHHSSPQYGPSPSSTGGYGYDDTKVLRHKSTIIVPEHGNSCPYGQSKDYHGHCRTIVRFSRPVFHPGQFVNSASANVGPPVRYYYKKYVAVPTLHFIIP